jgi:hypothetical protein
MITGMESDSSYVYTASSPVAKPKDNILRRLGTKAAFGEKDETGVGKGRTSIGEGGISEADEEKLAVLTIRHAMISYSRRNKDFVEELVTGMRRKGMLLLTPLTTLIRPTLLSLPTLPPLLTLLTLLIQLTFLTLLKAWMCGSIGSVFPWLLIS